MAKVSTYLNFNRNTEQAFLFYRSVFGGEFLGNGINRFGDIPSTDEMPAPAPEDRNLIMHVALALPGGHVLMGSDAPKSMGFTVQAGNNVHINLQLDTRAETKRLFEALSSGGEVTMELQDMFWGDYFGSCTDRFGVQWMFACSEKE